MRVALLQLNATVGDLAGNAERIAEWARRAGREGADLAITPEMSLTGYPPRDLLLQRGFVRRSQAVLEELARDLGDEPPVLVGLAHENPAPEGRPLFNAAALLRGGRVESWFRKSLLPTYDVFDEDRYFEPGPGVQVMSLAGGRFGVTICEDVWNDSEFWGRRRYHVDPIEDLNLAETGFLVNLSASPFSVGKQALRERMLGALASKYERPLVYVNQVGGNDDLVFDGRSTAYNAGGEVIARGAAFEEDLVLVDLDRGDGTLRPDNLVPEAETWAALVLGTRDYARKCGFSRVLVGLSGGIDSALTAAIAREALGAGQVLGVLMPSPYSSEGRVSDSETLARALGIATVRLPIEPIMRAFDETLAEPFAGLAPDATEENIQARIRGNLLMALANKHCALLLTTGNKSELAVGYCTLYGDMSGGLAVISDLPKTMVYRLARWLNREREIIPAPILSKAPSAELRPNQTDQDTLPPYDVLDQILERHIERYQSAEEITAAGFDGDTVRRVLHMVRTAEFKRKQAAPGLKVTDRAFGSGWRMPIAKVSWEERSDYRAARGE